MLTLIGELLRLLQVTTGLQLGLDAGLGLALLGAAAVAVLVVAARSVPGLVAADPTRAALRLRQTADPWRLLAQSDPDAPGRPRPRAPGRGIPAA
ncbi:DUF6412 domain-containing protein [Agromyces sp. G08B096]|uniref:DUF6412 domain-containing protein n=1 Tax=Agromyces sp. G08B096 TaxID=3156399 RepID=A0AAU7WBK5_9MICO